MSLPIQSTARCCIRAARSSHSRTTLQCTSTLRRTQSRRWQSTAAAAVTNPKIEGIVSEIGKLTLLETADLIKGLKTRLNLPDMPMGGFMAAGPAGGAPAAAAPVEEEDEAAPAAQEKTLFNLKLQSFEATSKPKVIKEIKAMLGLSLVDSKKFVESAPKLMKEGVPKEEAEKIVETLKALGAVVVME
ncbi:ClpS-like protein [Venturia nashicola]|uniref:ClpS-like protein n=1 Tax=Venturia nashicola TaxID=86259 RepID=A0A4Z1P0Q9_9PEZI|nr:ClpS-like protein [Venturia nashicola]TLD20973.1 ClpS-like protein [Venturia nashicola]